MGPTTIDFHKFWQLGGDGNEDLGLLIAEGAIYELASGRDGKQLRSRFFNADYKDKLGDDKNVDSLTNKLYNKIIGVPEDL